MENIKKEQSFWEKAIRFFEPLFNEKIVTLKTITIYSIWGITPIIHVVFIQKIVGVFEKGTRDEFIYILLLYILFNIFYEIVDFSLKKWGWVENINAYRKIIDSEYIKKYIGTDNSEIEKYGTGKMVSIITKGSDTWALALDTFILEITKISFIFLYSLFMFFKVGILYGSVFILTCLVVFYLGAIFNSQSLELRRKRLSFWHEYTRSFVRILMSKVEIMQSGKTPEEISRIHSYTNSMTQTNREMAFSVYACYRIAEASVIWLKIGVLFFVGLGYFSGDFNLSFFVALFAIMALMENTITQSMKFFRNFTKEFTTIESMWNFFDTTPQIQGYEEGNTFEYKKGSIKLKDVSYGYDSNKPVFKNFSLKIPGNQITALVGPSGGGKSTLVKLIAGYIRQHSGDILIDKQSLTETSLKSYYADVGYLTQEPSVFDGTVRENLMYGVNTAKNTLLQSNLSPTLSSEERERAAASSLLAGENGERCLEENEKNFNKHLKKIIKLAHCEFIYELPNGLDTEIGERGIKLSGGQKQRLAIAKIFLKDPKIIILDEPTSALDSLSEKKITEAMHNLFKNRTVLVIAHRLQTVKHADDIIVIENGEVIERGTHKELLKNKGFYKQMLDLQSGF